MRPQINIFDLVEVVPAFKRKVESIDDYRKEEILETVEITLKYRITSYNVCYTKLLRPAL